MCVCVGMIYLILQKGIEKQHTNNKLMMFPNMDMNALYYSYYPGYVLSKIE